MSVPLVLSVVASPGHFSPSYCTAEKQGPSAFVSSHKAVCSPAQSRAVPLYPIRGVLELHFVLKAC